MSEENKEVKQELTDVKPAPAPKKEPKKQKEIKVRFSLTTQIIYLVIALIVTVVIIVYQVTLQDEKKALLDQMTLRGVAVTTSFANSSQDTLSAIFLDNDLDKDNPSDYGEIDFFEVQEQLNVQKLLAQEDVIYAYIVNPFKQVMAHSDKSVDSLSSLQLPSGVTLFKDKYKKGQLVETAIQYYIADYKSTVSGEIINGEVIDFSFPLKLVQETKSIKTYSGEVHIGMSQEGILTTISKAKGKLLNVAFISVVIGLVGAYLLAMFISGPLKMMVAAMRKVAKGDLEQHIKIRRRDEIGVLGWNFNNMVAGLLEKEKMREKFNKSVSEEIAQVMMEGGDALGGEVSEVTMFFSDIRSFTSTSEKMTPHEVVAMLNEYLDKMTKIIIKYKGIVDKYVGDEIMAVWGTPVKRPNDVELCVRSAVEQMDALRELNVARVARGEKEIRVGVGMNTGEVISGAMGSELRIDYTVIGDNVNLAARLCDNANKKGLHEIICTESTYLHVKDIVIAKEVEPIYVKGKEKPIRIFEIHGIKEEYKEFTVE
jgi:class 3 adenylate cyclase